MAREHRGDISYRRLHRTSRSKGPMPHAPIPFHAEIINSPPVVSRAIDDPDSNTRFSPACTVRRYNLLPPILISPHIASSDLRQSSFTARLLETTAIFLQTSFRRSQPLAPPAAYLIAVSLVYLRYANSVTFPMHADRTTSATLSRCPTRHATWGQCDSRRWDHITTSRQRWEYSRMDPSQQSTPCHLWLNVASSPTTEQHPSCCNPSKQSVPSNRHSSWKHAVARSG